MPRRNAIFVWCAALIPCMALAQPPVGGFGGRSGGMGGMMGDPNALFDRFSRGKDVILRSDLDGFQVMMFDRIAGQMGITNGQITREQFLQATEQFMSRVRENGGRIPLGPDGASFNTAEAAARFAEERFRRADRNGDGLLQVEEMSDSLKSEREKWDTNKDGFIDLNEYKAYIEARFGQMRSERGESGPAAPGAPGSPEMPALLPEQPPEPEWQRPVVYRAGKLPKEIPDWFTQADTDEDGQVGLYEWIKTGRTIDEFRSMDRNDDSFLTAEEVLRFIKDGKTENYNLSPGGPRTVTPPSPRNGGPSSGGDRSANSARGTDRNGGGGFDRSRMSGSRFRGPGGPPSGGERRPSG